MSRPNEIYDAGSVVSVRALSFEGKTIYQLDHPLILHGELLKEIDSLVDRIVPSTLSAVRRVAADASHPLHLAYSLHREILGAATEVGPADWMRLDLGWSAKGELRVLEINTACPAGWLIHAHVADELAILQPSRVDDLLPRCPTRFGFSRQLLAKLGPRVAIVAMHGDYGFELEELCEEMRYFGGVCGVFDPASEGMNALQAFEPDGVYLKSDPLRVVEDQPIYEQIRELTNTVLSQPDWYTIGEDKRLLAELPSGGGVAETRHLSHDLLTWAINYKDELVLKPANLTRGVGVTIGRRYDDDQWQEAITKGVYSGDYVIQERCEMRSVQVRGKEMYGDLSVYVLDGVVTGFMARVSPEPVVNVGRTGFLQSVWSDSST